ncbi:MAG: glycoside hydrolase family 57 protein [Spirochaetota bacterium]
MTGGYLILLLHAHLPFVRHPEEGSFLEETWLFEAIAETYLPLLRVFRSLEADSVPFRLALSISPTLTAMLQDELLQQRFVTYCERMIELAGREVERTRDDRLFNAMAQRYRALHETNLREFVDTYNRDITRGFDYHYKRGRIEILATAATHAFLPLYAQYPAAARAQVQVGMESHKRVFGKASRGFWLPECGYTPGLEEHLAEQGAEYFFVATHGLVFGEHRPRAGVYAPTLCRNGVAAFGRDHASTNAVWSAEEGYPSDISYRDFYRDIGHDLPLEYIGEYLPEGRIRMNTGFKYYAVTGKTDQKLPYDPDVATKKVSEHAENFVYHQTKRVRRIASLMGAQARSHGESAGERAAQPAGTRVAVPPVISSPFDAELFGHWWFEGPQWLEQVIRRVAESEELTLVTPNEYLKEYPEHEVSTPAFSSWGSKGYAEVWLDGSNDWIYRHLHKAIDRMRELVERFPDESGLKRRALNQAAREVLLSQASDWPFIMHAGTAVPYAVRRVKDHVANVAHVYEALSRGTIGTEWLTRVERRHNLFPDMDYRVLGPSVDSGTDSRPQPSAPG